MRYLIFNKPYGILSQFSGAANTLKNYIQVEDVIHSAGWIAIAKGCFCLPTMANFNTACPIPAFNIHGPIGPRLKGFQMSKGWSDCGKGGTIQGRRTRPAQVRTLPAEPDLPRRDPPIRFRKRVPTAWIELILVEGRNRQVRGMTAAVGHPTLRLVRVAVGNLRLGELRPGEWRDLTATELRLLQN